MIADEPAPYGQDLGPKALGACVTMTIRMYADRKGWDLEEVEVHLEQSRVYAKDCEDCDSQDGFVHVIEKKLKFIGDLTEEQIQRLLSNDDPCTTSNPDHKLSNPSRLLKPCLKNIFIVLFLISQPPRLFLTRFDFE